MVSAKECGVIFDLDGVIVDTKEAHFQSFVMVGREEGFPVTEETFRAIFGRHNTDIFPILTGRRLSPREIETLADRKEAYFRDLIRGQVQALPGVPTLLPGLRNAGFRVAIGTSTPRANVDLILAELDLARYIDAMASAEDVTQGKPDPQVFLIAAERLGIPPARCVVVEDAVAGVQAALAGGMQALAVTTNHPRAALAQAHRVVDSLAEVSPRDFLALLSA